MTKHIYRVLEIVGGEKSITIKLFSVELSLYLLRFKVNKLIDLDVIDLDIKILSLYFITQKLKIFLLNNFTV